jgi:uncharacterized protein
MVWERAIRWPEIELPRGSFFSHLLNGSLDSTNLRFMDTETTGLSGGAGTTVFLSGCALVQNGTLTLYQTLLSDFPGERDFVQRTMDHLGRETVWVSYNGKSFDARQLQTRCLMNRIPPAFPFHIDLLYWARRLWNRMLPSCSLASIETHILGAPRVDDLPSIEVPERYFAFLESQDWSLLDPVFEHHLRDVRSLAELFLSMEELLTDLGKGRRPGVRTPDLCLSLEQGESGAITRRFDAYQLGRWLMSNSTQLGISLLEQVFARGGVMAADQDRAAFYLLRHYRRAKERLEAARIAGACATPSRLFLVEELAKFYEHDEQDPGKALAVLLAFCRRCPSADKKEQVQRRLQRLEKKLQSGNRHQ